MWKDLRGKKAPILAAIFVSLLVAVLFTNRAQSFRSSNRDMAAVNPENTSSDAGNTSGPRDAVPGRGKKAVLPSSLAGSWYPGEAAALRDQLEGFSRKGPDVSSRRDVIGLVLPHAGYSYSGQTAMQGLRAVGRDYKRIIVIGPSHQVFMENRLSLPEATHYQTPLGEAPLDLEFMEKLMKHPVFMSHPGAHGREHSVQIELPLLQYTRKNFKFVPIVAGSCDRETIKEAAGIIGALIDGETLVIASSDFVHYGKRFGYVPFTRNIPEQIKKLDMGAYEFIRKRDSRGFVDYRRSTGATICGYIPIAILLDMLPEQAEAHLVSQTTSGEMTGDYENSVSYLSVVFTGSWRKMEKESEKAGLSEQDREQLIQLARQSIEYFLREGRIPKASDLGIAVSGEARQNRAAFVTLKKKSRLRGCIGDILPRAPLYESVIENAINAAVRDHRFSRVTETELKELTISISALTVPESVDSPDRIRIGTDGVILKKAGKRAVFLPQVAPEQGWDVEETLTHLSVKAGLSPDDWKSGAEFQVFQAEVFGEK
ncbi:AmmeMemoRadiSam system protein B [Fibrobacterota bacterium]